MARSFTAADPAWKSLSMPALAWRKPFLQAVGAWSQSLSESHPRLYLLFAATSALAGYLWLLLFPWLVFASGHGLYEVVSSGSDMAWGRVFTWLVVGACSALVSYRLYRFRPALSAGNTLDSTTHSALFRLVADQSRHYRGTRIDHIVLSSDFGVDILKTLRFALPVRTTTTLVIGQPLLQCLSVTRFQCALARRLGQFSMRYNRLENWLYQLRGIWPQYCDLASMQGFGYQPVAWFYAVYAPVYNMIAAPAACLDELAADHYAMELFSDEEVLDTITTQMVCQYYLREKYWPVVRKYAARNSRVLDKIHSGMASVLRAGLQADTVGHWLAQTVSAEDRCGDTVPSLARRMDNIGFGGTRMDVLTSEPAAGVYLVK
ncbi:MAG: hypothetical protein WBQ78_08630 [Gammaproteobacteria bacterium]